MKICVACGNEIVNRTNRAIYCVDCKNPRSTCSARNALKRAIMKGLIPRLEGQFRCVDCGDVATEYDHRDYSKPLDVDPVCRSCNRRRGPGKYTPTVYTQRKHNDMSAKAPKGIFWHPDMRTWAIDKTINKKRYVAYGFEELGEAKKYLSELLNEPA